MLAQACEDFFPRGGFLFHKPWFNRFFSSPRFYFSASHPDPPIVGASDIGHGFTWPETGIQAWELNPGPIKIKSFMVRGSNPGPAKYCDHGHHEKHVIAIVGSQNNMKKCEPPCGTQSQDPL